MIERIAKLLNKAENAGTPQEAHIYFEKAQNLATAHSISLAKARLISTAGTPARPANTGELLPPPNNNSNSINSSNNDAANTPFNRPFDSQDAPSFYAPANERPAPSDQPPPETIRPDAVMRPEPINSAPIAPPRRVESVSSPTGMRPRMTNTKRFSLDYDVASIGPEGVADVELWGTAD